MPSRASLCGGETGDGGAVEPHRAFARMHQAHDGLQRRDLADAIAAKKAHDFARADLDRYAVQDVALAIISVHRLDRDERRDHARGEAYLLGCAYGFSGAHVFR